jgi:hypothetical protein
LLSILDLLKNQHPTVTIDIPKTDSSSNSKMKKPDFNPSKIQEYD